MTFVECWFFKCYIKTFAGFLMASQNNYVKILGCIIRYTTGANICDKSNQQIAQIVNCSTDTVRRAIDDFISCDLLKRISNTQLMLNPAGIIRGKPDYAHVLTKKYNAITYTKASHKRENTTNCTNDVKPNSNTSEETTATPNHLEI